MNKLKNIFFLIILLLFACNSKTNPESVELWKQEIQEVERRFAKLASEEGIHNAFVAFAADDAVLMRNNQLITGKNEIDQFYTDQNSKGSIGRRNLSMFRHQEIWPIRTVHLPSQRLIQQVSLQKALECFIRYGSDNQMDLGNSFGINNLARILT